MRMIVEQTKKYANRMIYNPDDNSFTSSDIESLAHQRHFEYPYGWIKESGTPPLPHCDCILMDDGEYNLGDEVEIKIIGMFKRNDGDHKYVVVRKDRKIKDISEITMSETNALKNFYPRADEGEGWFGCIEAMICYENCERAL